MRNLTTKSSETLTSNDIETLARRFGGKSEDYVEIVNKQKNKQTIKNKIINIFLLKISTMTKVEKIQELKNRGVKGVGKNWKDDTLDKKLVETTTKLLI